MKLHVAGRINAALLRVWRSINITGRVPEAADIALLARLSLGQAQTATEVMEAANAHRPRGTRPVALIDPAALPGLLRLVRDVAGP